MAKRKPKVLESTALAEPKAKKVDLDSLEFPNHLVSVVTPCIKTGTGAPDDVCTWPMTKLMHTHEGERAGAFIDPMHNADDWYLWANHPPTWFDPEVFAAMAMQDPEVMKVLQACWDQDTRKYEKLLVSKEHLTRVLQEKYMPYMLERFKQVQQLVAHYLVARNAGNEVQAEVDEEIRKHEEKHGKA